MKVITHVLMRICVCSDGVCIRSLTNSTYPEPQDAPNPGGGVQRTPSLWDRQTNRRGVRQWQVCTEKWKKAVG